MDKPENAEKIDESLTEEIAKGAETIQTPDKPRVELFSQVVENCSKQKEPGIWEQIDAMRPDFRTLNDLLKNFLSLGLATTVVRIFFMKGWPQLDWTFLLPGITLAIIVICLFCLNVAVLVNYAALAIKKKAGPKTRNKWIGVVVFALYMLMLGWTSQLLVFVLGDMYLPKATTKTG